MLKKYSFSDYAERLERAGLLKSREGTAGVIEAVCCDSGKASEGSLFVCKGNKFKPEYLSAAADAGACAYISEEEYPSVQLPHIIVSDARAALAEVSDLYYNSPWQRLNLIAVTGTKGKSTTVYYIKTILDAYFASVGKRPCGLISTIETFDGREHKASGNSTPESLEFQRILYTCAEAGLTAAVCEVSSQALKYSRVRCVRFDTGVFTNIGLDHISPLEHPDFEDYFQSKLSLFAQSARGVINVGSELYERVKQAAKDNCDSVVTYGLDASCDVRAFDIRKSDGRTVFRLSAPRFIADFSLSMPGIFNVENAAAAIAAALPFGELGLEPELIKSALESAKVPGRMELYSSDDGQILALVDYAHNALSFEELFASIKREYPDYTVVSVFGAPGGKAQIRRKSLGQIAGANCSHVYLTSDDPDFEEPSAIAADIAEGLAEHNCPYTFIEEREQAVVAAFAEAKPKTIILLLGCGNETRQKIKGAAVPVLSDAECVRLCLSPRQPTNA